MTRIRTWATISRPIEDVFAFVTTPAYWPRWHPSSLAVSGVTDHSLLLGEQLEETFRVAGHRGRVVWTVTDREAPCRWTIDGKIVGGSGSGVVTYTLAPIEDGAGTHFVREFIYPISSPGIAVLDRLYVRRRITAESAEALRRLKALLEADGPDGAARP